MENYDQSEIFKCNVLYWPPIFTFLEAVSMHISQPTYYADACVSQSALDKLLANMHLFCDGKHYMAETYYVR